MIVNLIRTIWELRNYLGEIGYPKTRIVSYVIGSIFAGIILSNSHRAADLPILTLTAILFGFTINAVVLLGNSSEHYLSSDIKHSDSLESLYEKSLYISIHTLGIGMVTIVVIGIYQLFPDMNLYVIGSQIMGHRFQVELVSLAAYSLTVYYLVVFSIVIASTAELVKIRV